MEVINDVLSASDNRLVSVPVLLDLSAASHTTDHNILLQRLEHFIVSFISLNLRDGFQLSQVYGEASMFAKGRCEVYF